MDIPPAMDQRIFNMRLSTEAVSLYLLVCSLADAGLPISLDNIRQRWNSGPEVLDKSLAALEDQHVLEKEIRDGEAPVYRLMDADDWGR